MTNYVIVTLVILGVVAAIAVCLTVKNTLVSSSFAVAAAVAVMMTIVYYEFNRRSVVRAEGFSNGPIFTTESIMRNMPKGLNLSPDLLSVGFSKAPTGSAAGTRQGKTSESGRDGDDAMSMKERNSTAAPETMLDVFDTPEHKLLPKQVADHLSVYVSTLTPDSYSQKLNKVWKNVAASPHTKSMQCNANGQTSDSDFHFDQTPAYTSPTARVHASGVMLGASNSITGPMSHQLRIYGDKSYSLFFVCSIVPSAGSVREEACVLKIFANTSTNVGVSVNFIPGADPDTFQYSVQLGDSEKQETEDIVTKGVHLCVLVKRFGIVTLDVIYLDQCRLKERKVRVKALDADVGNDLVILSNLEMKMNPDKKWNALLIAFGISTQEMDDDDIDSLSKHYSALFRTVDPERLKLMQQVKQLKDKEKVLRACPFDEDTCNVCSEDGIKDWSSGTALSSNLHMASKACLTSINEFCLRNPKHANCACWDDSNPKMSQSVACKRYRSIFSGDNVCPPKAVCPPPLPPPTPPPLPPPTPPKKCKRPPRPSEETKDEADTCMDEEDTCMDEICSKPKCTRPQPKCTRPQPKCTRPDPTRTRPEPTRSRPQPKAVVSRAV